MNKNFNHERLRLGEILVRDGTLSPEERDLALREQKSSGGRLGEILTARGMITESRLAAALSEQLNVPLIPLARCHPMPEALKLLPRAAAERLSMIPLSVSGDGALLVAMADPLDLPARDEARRLTGRSLQVGIAARGDIEKNLERFYSLQSSLDEAAVELEKLKDANEDEGTGETDAPVIQIVSDVLSQAVREGASDIHLEIYDGTARVRFRVDGRLYTVLEYPAGLHPSVTARVKIMSGMDIAERRRPQDGRLLTQVDGRRIDLRVSSLPAMNGEDVVLRILDRERAFTGLEQLGLEPDDMEKIKTFCGLPWGIVLAAGPTGSGKSTTLYAMLQQMNKPDINIITVEDPVEFSIAGVNQVHVNEKAGLTFETALRSILRQDPDKIMVGEIRDRETAHIAIRAALTGHFVLSTLHTNDAPGAAARMVDMGIPPFLVSASLSGVIAQRLIRRLCPHCREEYGLDANTCGLIGVPPGTRAFRARGCGECRGGYRGRRGIYEIMTLDEELRRMILDGAGGLELREAAIRKGMKTLRRSAVLAALSGETSLEEVLSSTL